jgi:hypothetical protein
MPLCAPHTRGTPRAHKPPALSLALPSAAIFLEDCLLRFNVTTAPPPPAGHLAVSTAFTLAVRLPALLIRTVIETDVDSTPGAWLRALDLCLLNFCPAATSPQ